MVGWIIDKVECCMVGDGNMDGWIGDWVNK